jgi:hypothetical protein
MFKQLLSFSEKEWHKNIYYYGNFISIGLVIIAYTGIIHINPLYIKDIHSFLLFYVCAILLIRFNPYIKTTNSDFDRKIAFTAGVILLISVTASQVTTYVIPAKEFIEDILTI